MARLSANSGVRNRLIQLQTEKKWDVFIPDFQYCTDNAGMIAVTGYFMCKKELFTDQTVAAMARLPFNK